MERLKRIALYGGTFDPVHLGHITVAERLLKLFSLDEVLFIPAHTAPHKRHTAVTPALHRYAMLALATQHEARFLVSTIEIDAPERPFTIDTLSRLRAIWNDTAQLFFVMGSDSWMEITTWHRWEEVLALSNHLVVTRPGYELSTSHVTRAIRERIVDLRGVAGEEVARVLDENGDPKIYLTDAVKMEMAATDIRRQLQKQDPVAEQTALQLPPPVADYIRKYRLYRDVHETEFFDAEAGPSTRKG